MALATQLNAHKVQGSGFNEKIHSDNPYMKLRQNGTVSFSIKLAETVNRLNIEHRTLNVERPILMALRFIYFITSEPQNIE